jgi:hypothetical protein
MTGVSIADISGETLIKSFDRLRANGNLLVPFVVSRELVERSNHEWNQLVQEFLKQKGSQG